MSTVPFDIESLKNKVKEAVKRSRLRQKQKKGKFGLLDSFQQAMVAATFAQGGEFESARSILNEKNDDPQDEVNKETGKIGRKTDD